MRRNPYVIAAVITLMGGISAAIASTSLSAGSRALQSANETMHQAMGVEMTGDVDVDFVRGMIPHHEGAVEMAKIVLQYGNDPQIKELAEKIVAAQESEIAFMKEWLAKNGVSSPVPDAMNHDGMDHGAH